MRLVPVDASDWPTAGEELALDRGIPLSQSAEDPAPGLLKRLAAALEERGIPYCQWKGHWSTHRWATGHGEVHLLVEHGAAQECRQLLTALGFKPALPQRERQIPGGETYIGHDPDVPRLLRLDVHYRLLLGDFWKPVYRIPIERPLLHASAPGALFRVPTPTHQFVLFVLRIMLRQVGRPLLSLQRRWLAGVQAPLASLEASCDWRELNRLFADHLPSMNAPFFERCVRSIQGQSGWMERATLPWLLVWRLRAHRRRPPVAALFSAAVERFAPGAATRREANQRLRLVAGGTVVGLLGGGGTGKTSCARELCTWLEPVIPTLRARLGQPPRSLLTQVVIGASWLQEMLLRRLNREVTSRGWLELLRIVCVARDRHRLYLEAQRFAAAGDIAICEDYPLPETRALIGPSLPPLLGPEPNVVQRALRQFEKSCYERLVGPDVLCVLRLDPDTAAQRKSGAADDEGPSWARVIWEADWSRSGAHLVDAGRPLPAVLSQLKSILWQRL